MAFIRKFLSAMSCMKNGALFRMKRSASIAKKYTVEHTVGEVNGSYWFKVDIGSQEGESNYEEEP